MSPVESADRNVGTGGSAPPSQARECARFELDAALDSYRALVGRVQRRDTLAPFCFLLSCGAAIGISADPISLPAFGLTVDPSIASPLLLVGGVLISMLRDIEMVYLHAVSASVYRIFKLLFSVPPRRGLASPLVLRSMTLRLGVGGKSLGVVSKMLYCMYHTPLIAALFLNSGLFDIPSTALNQYAFFLTMIYMVVSSILLLDLDRVVPRLGASLMARSASTAEKKQPADHTAPRRKGGGTSKPVM